MSQLKNKATTQKNIFLREKYFFVFLLFYGLAGLFVNFYVGFHQSFNDFWDLYFGTRFLSLHNAQSLYSPYFPIGYFAFLKAIIGSAPPEIPAIFANILFGIILLAVSYKLCRTLLSPAISLFFILLLSIYPRIFYYNFVGGADPLSLALFAIGSYFLIPEFLNKSAGKGRTFFIAGLFFGLGALVRYHVLVGAGMLIFSLLLVYRRSWKHLTLCAVGVAAAYLVQLIIYFLSAPHTVHFAVMNIYNLMYPLDWYHTITLHLPKSPLELIFNAPLLFAKKYAEGVAQHALDFIPPLIAFFAVRDTRLKKVCGAIALWTMGYSLFFGAMTSGRSLLLPLPLSFLCWGLEAQRICAYTKQKITKRMFAAGVIASVMALLTLFGFNDVMKIKNRYLEHRTCSSVETLVRHYGCTGVREIFSTDFYLYFRTMPPYVPYFNGGAPRWGVYRYNEEYPEFADATLADFSAACRERGVHFVLLTSPCRLRSEALGTLYDKPDCSDDFIFKKEIDRFKIFMVAPHPLKSQKQV